MRRLILILLFSINFSLVFGQSSYKWLILENDASQRSINLPNSEFISNNTLVANYDISGRGVYTTYLNHYNPFTRNYKMVVHPADSLIPYAVPEEYDFGPWLSGPNFLGSHTYSTGPTRYFFSVKYDTLSKPIWKVDNLRIYKSAFTVGFGDFIQGTKDYINTTYLRVSETGKTEWKINFLDSTSIVNPKIIKIQASNEHGFLLFSNDSNQSELLEIDTNGTISRSVIFNKNVIDFSPYDTSYYLVEKDSIIHISLLNENFATLKVYSFVDTFQQVYKSLQISKNGVLISIQNMVSRDIFGVSSVPELRLLSHELTYKKRRYFRMSSWTPIPNIEVYYYIGIGAFANSIVDNGFYVLLQSGSYQPYYGGGKKYHILKTDSNFNVQDSIQLNGQIRLNIFDTILTPPTKNAMIYDNVKELNKKDFVIFPNPTSGHINIRSEDEILKATIYDLTGKNILEKAHINLNYINVSQIPKGQYILELVSDKGVIRKKVLVE